MIVGGARGGGSKDCDVHVYVYMTCCELALCEVNNHSIVKAWQIDVNERFLINAT